MQSNVNATVRFYRKNKSKCTARFEYAPFDSTHMTRTMSPPFAAGSHYSQPSHTNLGNHSQPSPSHLYSPRIDIHCRDLLTLLTIHNPSLDLPAPPTLTLLIIHNASPDHPGLPSIPSSDHNGIHTGVSQLPMGRNCIYITTKQSYTS